MPRMKLVVVMAVLAIAAVASAQGSAKNWDFQADQVDRPPVGFTFARTGQGSAGEWLVKIDPSAPAGNHVLVQIDADGTDYRFPVAVADAPVLKDVRAEVRCKPVAGRIDRACGLVVRYQDADNYYVTRANALEDNVNLYKVVKGRRQELAGWNGSVAANVWHTLAIEARGSHLRVLWEGKAIIDAEDATLEQGGKVGLWTKADSVTAFDGLTASALR